MNTFSIAVSKRLREIGVEGDTDIFWLYGTNGEELCSIDRMENSDEHWIHLVDKIPAYTLHDILRLMPKIGEKMGWTQYVNCVDGKEHGYTPLGNGKYSDTCRWCKVRFKMPPDLHELTESFLSGDYPEAEKVLLDLLKEHGK